MNELQGDAAPTAEATPAAIRATVDPQQDRREIVLRVTDLRKRYGANEVVRGLSFEIRRGDCFGLLGP
ncbi:MAG: ABC transporter ATP-binding protein, partial [Betaproteobacteria bacterium]|nr:ABC transporter ATP-binding protein [Betaproteobacteria bacterium]